MSLFNTIIRAFVGDPGDPFTLDNVPVKALEIGADWRDEKVKEAAERYGKPFKCAADGVPRERYTLDRQIEVVRPKATVTPIRRKPNAKEK